jgi:hypothetical protein
MMDNNDGEQHAHENPHKIDEDHHGRGIAYRVAEFGLYSIFLAGDVFEFWGEHRVFALTVAVAGLGFLLVIDRGFSLRTVARLVIGAAFLAVISYFLIPETHTPVAQTVPSAPPMARPSPEIGWLQPGNEPTPANPCGKKAEKGLMVIVGDSAFVATNPAKPFIPLEFGSCNIAMENGPNGMSINATIYDRSGGMLGKLAKTKFEITKEKGLIIERSGDLTALIVHNDKDEELLNVRWLNPKVIRIRGVLSCPTPKLRTIVVTNEEIQTGGLHFRGSCTVGGSETLGGISLP